MQRILVIGSGGTGKSTLARRLGGHLGIEVVHLDRLHWQPGWVGMPKSEWRRTVDALTQRPSWILDGNYASTLDLRIAACDALVFLDYPRLVCLWGALRRVLLASADTVACVATRDDSSVRPRDRVESGESSVRPATRAAATPEAELAVPVAHEGWRLGRVRCQIRRPADRRHALPHALAAQPPTIRRR